MREIKFRGKAIMSKHELDYFDIPNHKSWVEGNLIMDGLDCYIVGAVVEASDDGLVHEWWAKVHPETIGQYTGIINKDSRELYEGDILGFEDLTGFGCDPEDLLDVKERWD